MSVYPGRGIPVAAEEPLPGGASQTPIIPGGRSGMQQPAPGSPGYGGFFYAGNPRQAVRDYMNNTFGEGAADTNMPFGDWIKGLMGDLIPVLMQTTLDQNGQPALDRLADIQGLLDPILRGGAGTLGGNLVNWANQAEKGLLGSVKGMNFNTQADLLRNLTALRTISANPYMAEAQNRDVDRAIGAAGDYASNIIRTGGQMPGQFSLWDWISQQLPTGYTNPLQR